MSQQQLDGHRPTQWWTEQEMAWFLPEKYLYKFVQMASGRRLLLCFKIGQLLYKYPPHQEIILKSKSKHSVWIKVCEIAYTWKDEIIYVQEIIPGR